MGRIYGDLRERTLAFGERILHLTQSLPNDPRGWTIGKQVCRSGTSVGANVWEADAAHSDADFTYRISIARKEANETSYWLELAARANLVDREYANTLKSEAEELTRILGAVIKRMHDREPD